MWVLVAESAFVLPVLGVPAHRQASGGKPTSRPRRWRTNASRVRVVVASSKHPGVGFFTQDESSGPEPKRETRKLIQPNTFVPDLNRRAVLAGTSLSIVSAVGKLCGCGGCAYAMADLVRADPAQSLAFDVARDARMDAAFAEGMSVGMTGYEIAIAERKHFLFKLMLQRLPRGGSDSNEATIVEVGMGTFPNAHQYFGSAETYDDCLLPAAALGSKPPCDVKQQEVNRQQAPLPLLDIVGVDPNDSMEKYAAASFADARNSSTNKKKSIAASLRIAHGVAEALPLASNSADAVVCTLTLCSVLDPAKALAEIRRVLKPGGSFLFIEHVLSDERSLRAQQIALDGLQAKLADGCHLNRQTLASIENAGFARIETVQRFTLPGFGLISSQIAGLAINA